MKPKIVSRRPGLWEAVVSLIKIRQQHIQERTKHVRRLAKLDRKQR